MKPAERQNWKAAAHKIKPVVTVGKNGLTQTLTKEIDANLSAHELIKIKFQSAKEEIETTSQKICDQLKAELIEIRGFIVTIYRPNPKKPKGPRG